ncbi:DUF501 domain-containing protein [Pseudothermotoga sp.]|uniref:DUF501 domain-containing protein n=1 Tax=Pseudothermotoga sp. TaxID=2033661 RepID=UPI0031FE3403
MLRCEHNFPVVIENKCEINGRPFPTLFWLVCPKLCREISRLEGLGWISKFERIIDEDPNFEGAYINAHMQVRRLRDKVVRDERVRRILSRLGTGGIRNLKTVKCLHLHVADRLAGVKNPVGEMVLRMIDRPFCEGERILCRELRA